MTLHITEGPTHTLYQHRCCGCGKSASAPASSMTQANLEALANDWELTQWRSWCPECAIIRNFPRVYVEGV